MLIALSVKNKLGFIDGSISKPTGNLLPAWIRNNHIVIAWILNSVSKTISGSLLFSESARDIWIDLKDRFQKKNGPRIFQLKRNLATITQDQQSVTMYFTRLKTLWDEYITYRPGCTCGRCTCGGQRALDEFFQFEYLMSFLMGLNESFAPTRAQILLMDPPPSASKAFSLLSQEEQQRTIPIFATPPPVVAFAAPSRPQTQSTSRTRKDRPICTHCGIQ